jgi:hypothetical protein
LSFISDPCGGAGRIRSHDRDIGEAPHQQWRAACASVRCARTGGTTTKFPRCRRSRFLAHCNMHGRQGHQRSRPRQDRDVMRLCGQPTGCRTRRKAIRPLVSTAAARAPSRATLPHHQEARRNRGAIRHLVGDAEQIEWHREDRRSQTKPSCHHRHHMPSKERFCPLPFRSSPRGTAPDQIACQSDRDGAVYWSHAMDQQLRNTIGCANFDRAHLE